MNSVTLPYLGTDKYQTLAAIAATPNCLFFDSGRFATVGEALRFGERRFDVLLANPYLTYQFSEQGHVLAGADVSTELPQSPFAALRQLEDWARQKGIITDSAQVNHLPFCGGIAGYISYDIGRVIEKLPSRAVNDLQCPYITVGLYDWAVITDHQIQQTQLHYFGQLPERLRQIKNWFDTYFSATETESEFIVGKWQKEMNFSDYEKAFTRIQQYIAAGDVYQVNFAQRFSATFSGNPWTAYAKLAEFNNAPFSVFANLNDMQLLSLSPERFIQVKDGQVLTQPIKGTRPRREDAKQDQVLKEQLAHSEKDRAENLMIVDLLRNDLSRTAKPGSVNVSELFGVYSFNSVHHLISSIESQLEHQYDCYDVLQTTLPGGSITGAPKIRAMEIIDELEPVRRQTYCGILGYFNRHTMDTNIAIRTLLVKNAHIYAWAGGGLVIDSDLQAEYQETLDKLGKVLPVLNPEFSDGSAPYGDRSS